MTSNGPFQPKAFYDSSILKQGDFHVLNAHLQACLLRIIMHIEIHLFKITVMIVSAVKGK